MSFTDDELFPVDPNWISFYVNDKTGPDMINSPPHYLAINATCSLCKCHIECIDVTRHMNFNLGNAMKYIWRCECKGEKIENLKKAIWYLKDEIKKEEKNAIQTG